MDPPRLRLCRDCLRKDPPGSARCAHCGSPRTISLDDAAGLDNRPCRLRRLLRRGRKARRPEPQRQAVDRRRLRPARRRRHLLLHRPDIRRALGDADVAGPGALSERRGAPARHGQICAGRARDSNADDGAHAAGRAAVDRRGFSRPQRLRADPTERARRKRWPASPARVEVEVGVTVSVGLSYCKFLAKLASDLNKPRGFACLSREEAKAWLATQSVERLWGVGRVGRERLERSGFRLIGDLQRIDEREAVLRLGEDGLRLWRLAQGRDDRAVHAERETKSVSSRDDVRSRHQRQGGTHAHPACAMRPRRHALAAGGAGACGITLKLRLADFSLRTRSRSGFRATQLAPRLFAAARPLLDAQPDGVAYRLLGSRRNGACGRPKARTKTTCSCATAAARKLEKRRSLRCGTGSAPRRCSGAHLPARSADQVSPSSCRAADVLHRTSRSRRLRMPSLRRGPSWIRSPRGGSCRP